MLAAAKEDLAAAVEDGRLTAAQRQEILADLPARIADLVDRSFDRGPATAGAVSPRGRPGRRGGRVETRSERRCTVGGPVRRGASSPSRRRLLANSSSRLRAL